MASYNYFSKIYEIRIHCRAETKGIECGICFSGLFSLKINFQIELLAKNPLKRINLGFQDPINTLKFV